jgi:hypothetical protein
MESKGEASGVYVLLSGSPGLTSQRLRVDAPHVMVHRHSSSRSFPRRSIELGDREIDSMGHLALRSS